MATVLYQRENVFFKLCKVIFNTDGSFMVMTPYHPQKSCAMFKLPINMTTLRRWGDSADIPFSHTVDAGAVEERQVKLSHHLSGFVQFSGPGVLSGLDDMGNPRGMGVRSFALDNPASGPSFGILFFGLEEYRQVTSPPKDAIVFRESELCRADGMNALIVEGFYVPPGFRQFAKVTQGGETLDLTHPSGAVMHLAVVSAPANSPWPGLIGIHLYPIAAILEGVESGFLISGPTGSERQNEKGETIRDGIYCISPGDIDLPKLRDLNFPLPVPK